VNWYAGFEETAGVEMAGEVVWLIQEVTALKGFLRS